jgi:hypothetical protein
VVPPGVVPVPGSSDLLHELSKAGARNSKLPLISALLKNSFLSILTCLKVITENIVICFYGVDSGIGKAVVKKYLFDPHFLNNLINYWFICSIQINFRFKL